MYITARTFCLPKQGHTEAEYEDAYYPKYFINQEFNVFSCAIADGATETSFSGQWAQILVEAYCEDSLRVENLTLVLPLLQQKWMTQVKKQPLPWYAEEKLRSGAFSTLVGLTLYRGSHCGEVIAIGDSCLFHIRQDELKMGLPLKNSAAFKNKPFLLSTLQHQPLFKHFYQIRTRWEQGDEFYLMTDALACWFLREYEHQQKPWEALRQLTPSHFKEWVLALRRAQKLDDDDVTVMQVVIQA